MINLSGELGRKKVSVALIEFERQWYELLGLVLISEIGQRDGGVVQGLA